VAGQSTSGASLAQNGERLFASLSCNACHNTRPDARGPSLANVYGAKLTLASGGSGDTADDAYLREAILNPSQHVTQGYAPIMPTYQGQISEEGVIALVEYIKNLDSDYRVQQTLNTPTCCRRAKAKRPAATKGPQARRARDGEAMSATIVSLPDQSTARIPKMNYLTKENGLLSWLLTGDHKRIAILYLISISFFFFIGGALAGLIRLELLTPQSDLMATDTYNKVFTMHGVIMIFFFLVPSVPATLGNFLYPDDDRRQGSGAAQDQPAELVSLHGGRHSGHLHHGAAAWIRAGPSPRRSPRTTSTPTC
jgi:cytochrome c2